MQLSNNSSLEWISQSQYVIGWQIIGITMTIIIIIIHISVVTVISVISAITQRLASCEVPLKREAL